MFQKAFICNAEFGGKLLMKFDSDSMRTFLIGELGLHDSVPEVLELVSYSTGYLNSAFVEIVLDEMQFQSKDWFTIDGGMSKLTEALVEMIDANKAQGCCVTCKSCGKARQGRKILYGAKVHGIEKNKADGDYRVHFKLNGKPLKTEFSNLIITTTAPVIETWDMPWGGD
jgi:hypothetical protein